MPRTVAEGTNAKQKPIEGKGIPMSTPHTSLVHPAVPPDRKSVV